MYRNKKKIKKVKKTNVFEHPIVSASNKEKIPEPKQIFDMHKISNKDKKKVKKNIKNKK